MKGLHARRMELRKQTKVHKKPLLEQLKQDRNSLKMKMKIVRDFMVQTGATLPEIVLSLLPKDKKEDFSKELMQFST